LRRVRRTRRRCGFWSVNWPTMRQETNYLDSGDLDSGLDWRFRGSHGIPVLLHLLHPSLPQYHIVPINSRNYLVILRTTGGEAPGGSALAPKIGPLGLVRSFERSFRLVRGLTWVIRLCSRRRRSEMISPRLPRTGRD
jgi:hypothetical protein